MRAACHIHPMQTVIPTAGTENVMSKKPKIALVIGSTRKTRFADKPAQWMLKQAQARDDMEVELVDLRDFDLPLFDEAASNLWMPSSDPRAVAWQKKMGEFDGYIFVVAEYNRSLTGSLKNALDQAYKEWVRKPFTAIAYGSVGGARALEHLRNVGVELQMVPTRNAVHIGMGDFFKVHPLGGTNAPIEDIEANILPAAKAALDDLVWWAKATMAAKA
jgi:NAD(P)H-dependent FMN reductase